MLLFINNHIHSTATVFLFQYISCCYLSPPEHCPVADRYCFNTSHVVIYLQCSVLLNHSHVVSIHLMLLFIWKFRCYTFPNYSVSIHLMLLFITLSDVTSTSAFCFNTSHVVIYRIFIHTFLNRRLVSIHLMLLFITK